MQPDATLLVIGAGPAGLFAAWTFRRLHPEADVLVMERLPVPGEKLAASGGGRGNLSHLATEDEFASVFGRHGRFTIPAFRSLPPEALQHALASMGIPTIVDPDGRLYPRSQSARQVRDALWAACQRAGVRFVFRHPVAKLTPPDGSSSAWRVDSFTAQSVLLAAGGRSAPRLGSDGSGFSLAASLGFDLVPPVPALTALITEESWPADHSGLSLADVRVTIVGARPPGHSVRGEILFTHRGLSGPAILNLSGRIARLHMEGHPVQLQIGLFPVPPDFQQLRRIAGTRMLAAWLAGHVPRALAGTLLDLAGIPRDQTVAHLSAAQEQSLVARLTACPLTVRGTGGFDSSMVTAGGVSLTHVRPETLEGRRTPRLHLAGEILNLDAPTGGWNLHWAFCSGHLAAESIRCGGD